jgi:acyl-coenzyme A synthetase/AMP-(fatty) acid ligase
MKIEFWKELAKTPVGKILKREVRKHFWSASEKQ